MHLDWDTGQQLPLILFLVVAQSRFWDNSNASSWCGRWSQETPVRWMKKWDREGKEANIISIVNLTALMSARCQLSFWEAFRIRKHWQMASGLHHHCLLQHHRRCALLTLFLAISLQESLLAQLSSLTEWFLGGWVSLSQLLRPSWFTEYSKVLWWAKGTWWIICNTPDFLGYSQMYATHSIPYFAGF